MLTLASPARKALSWLSARRRETAAPIRCWVAPGLPTRSIPDISGPDLAWRATGTICPAATGAIRRRATRTTHQRATGVIHRRATGARLRGAVRPSRTGAMEALLTGVLGTSVSRLHTSDRHGSGLATMLPHNRDGLIGLPLQCGPRHPVTCTSRCQVPARQPQAPARRA
jgi:hypothetical protein